MNTDLVIHGDNLSEAWARTVITVAAAASTRHATSSPASSDPTQRTPQVREMADGILAERDMAPISTVGNTLFPDDLAHPDSRSRGHLGSQIHGACCPP